MQTIMEKGSDKQLREAGTTKTTLLDLSSKRQIEAELHEKLEGARIEYESASEGYKRALKRCDEVRLTNRDGDGSGVSQAAVEQPVSQALNSQHDAFEKYRRTLDDFNKFLLYGDLPDSRINVSASRISRQ
jgi:hypothetical protein